MIGEGCDIVRVKVSQQWYCDAFIHIDAPEGHRPSGRIACTDSDLIALLDTGGIKEDAEAFNVGGQLGIGKGVAIVVTQGFTGPLLTYGFLQVG